MPGLRRFVLVLRARWLAEDADDLVRLAAVPLDFDGVCFAAARFGVGLAALRRGETARDFFALDEAVPAGCRRFVIGESCTAFVDSCTALLTVETMLPRVVPTVRAMSVNIGVDIAGFDLDESVVAFFMGSLAVTS